MNPNAVMCYLVQIDEVIIQKQPESKKCWMEPEVQTAKKHQRQREVTLEMTERDL